ncbi:MAG: hypothetical protein H0W15_06945 [Gemmatimonadales bacterium]|nr:hypothetical protein [Gemmatimonadales bacterium]
MKPSHFLLVTLLLAPTVAGAQQVTGRAEGTATAQAPAARIEAAMDAAVRANVPRALLESKVAEGEAKRVPPERIAAAVEARSTSLIRATTLLQSSGLGAQGAAQISVTADALDAGVSESALLEVTRSASTERRTVAVAVLADLVRLGGGSASALGRVSAALGSNGALANLQAEVATQLRQGGQRSILDATGIIGIH